VAENVAAVFLDALPSWEIRLISYAITAVITAAAYWVLRRAQANSARSTSVTSLKRSSELVAAVPLAVFGLVIVLFAVILVLARAPLWTLLLGVPVVVWAGWWLPSGRRQIASEATVAVNELPARVSAFVADVMNQPMWSPGVTSCVPTMAGANGPRYVQVGTIPDSGRQISGTVELTRNEPGVAVVLQVVGAGASGDYYTFAARDGGTIVTVKSLVELPYPLALMGGMFMARGDAPAAHQRRVAELQALKTAIEAAP
jgi:hypothetical protein